MRSSRKSLFFVCAAILAVVCLAGCTSAISSALSSLPSRTATAPAGPTATETDSPTPADSPTPTPTPTVTTSPTTAPASPSTPPPTTVPPSTATVTTTTTAPASTTAPATPSSVSATPAAASSNSLLWLWILLGAAVLAGLITWIVVASRRRSASAAGWRSRLIDAYAKGSALHDAMSVAEAQGATTAGDAGARWYDIQRRADDLAQTLYALREAVPDEDDRARIADTLASLQAVRSAMEAERAPGGAGWQQADVVRGRLAAFESSLRALRAAGSGRDVP